MCFGPHQRYADKLNINYYNSDLLLIRIVIFTKEVRYGCVFGPHSGTQR